MARVALDYDKTYTVDPVLWDAFIVSAQSRGHEVVCVTMRRPDQTVTIPCPVIYTSRRAKVSHMEALGKTVDIWIDDSPFWLLHDG